MCLCAHSAKLFSKEHFMVEKLFSKRNRKKKLRLKQKKFHKNWKISKQKQIYKKNIKKSTACCGMLSGTDNYISSCTNTCNCDNLLERVLFVYNLFWLRAQLLFSVIFLIPFHFLHFIFVVLPSNFSTFAVFHSYVCCCRMADWLIIFFCLSVVLLHLINFPLYYTVFVAT